MIPMLGGGRLETDRKIPGPHWPVRLTKSMNSRLSEKPYLKNEVEIGHGTQRQVNLREFKTSLTFKVSFKTGIVTW